MPADICLPAALCPACRRIRRHEAPHLLTIAGMPPECLAGVAALVKNVACAEVSTHCEERLVFVRREGDRLAIGTTGKHLARRIGTAIRKAWKRDVRLLGQDDETTRLCWTPSIDSRRGTRR